MTHISFTVHRILRVWNDARSTKTAPRYSCREKAASGNETAVTEHFGKRTLHSLLNVISVRKQTICLLFPSHLPVTHLHSHMATLPPPQNTIHFGNRLSSEQVRDTVFNTRTLLVNHVYSVWGVG